MQYQYPCLCLCNEHFLHRWNQLLFSFYEYVHIVVVHFMENAFSFERATIPCINITVKDYWESYIHTHTTWDQSNTFSMCCHPPGKGIPVFRKMYKVTLMANLRFSCQKYFAWFSNENWPWFVCMKFWGYVACVLYQLSIWTRRKFGFWPQFIGYWIVM